MSAEPVNGWDARVLAASETTLGTTPNPAASQAMEIISINTGPLEVGRTRPQADRNTGRGHTNKFVEGRVEPIAFDLSTSQKSRSAVDTVPKESPLLKAGGLLETVNTGVSVVYTLPADPIGAAAFKGLSLFRGLGPDTYRYEGEQLRGGVIRSLEWTGGDKELQLKAAGVALGKYQLGYVESITLADGSGTSLTLTAEQSYRVGPGWYQVESEIILVQGTVSDMGLTTRTIARAQLGSTGAAHAAKAMIPYMPSLTFAGSPISEANCTWTLDSVAMRALSFSLTVETGMDLLPGETGSRYVQGAKAGRAKVMAKIRSLMHREEAAWIGKATTRKSVALSLICGTGTGGIATFSLPQGEIRPFPIPDSPNDVVTVEIPFEAKDSSSGNDELTLTLT